MKNTEIITVPPSPHALSLTGVDLSGAELPAVRVAVAREVVVVLSRSRDPAREVYLERCRRDGVPVLIRPSGGGAVVLAPGVVAGSLVLSSAPHLRFPEQCFEYFCRLVAEALARRGVAEVEARGNSDLCLGERKIAGSSLRVWRDRVLFQVALLVEADIELLERYLQMPSRQPAYRRQRPHREFVTTLRSAGFPVSSQEVADALGSVFAAATGATAQ